MKVNIWKRLDKGISQGDISITTSNSAGEDYQKSNPESYMFLGTTELTLEVPKKEVEKVVKANTSTYFYENQGTKQRITNDYLPEDAYDITVHYKVKE
jgi:hypothetical protein